MMRSTIQTEIIQILEHKAMKSSRIHTILQKVEQCESSFELIRLLTSAVLSLDEIADSYQKQVEKTEAWATTRTMLVDEDTFKTMYLTTPVFDKELP